MHRFVRIMVGWVSIIGGVFGLIKYGATLLILGKLPPFVTTPALVVGIVFFSFGVVAGVLTLRSSTMWRLLALIFWLIQVPLVMSPGFSYSFSALLGSWLFVSMEAHMGARSDLGSWFQVGPSFSPYTVTAFGINLVAALIALVIFQSGRRRDS